MMIKILDMTMLNDNDDNDFSMISVTVTYLIILIQFKMSEAPQQTGQSETTSD